jgi:predicted  nucleic acid-binding Zn-ribbon protein
VTELPWAAVSLVCTVLIGIYTWIATGQRVHREQLDSMKAELSKRIGHVEQTIATIDERLKHVPTADQVSALAVAIGELREAVRGVSTQVTGMNARLERIEDYMSRQQ